MSSDQCYYHLQTRILSSGERFVSSMDKRQEEAHASSATNLETIEILTIQFACFAGSSVQLSLNSMGPKSVLSSVFVLYSPIVEERYFLGHWIIT